MGSIGGGVENLSEMPVGKKIFLKKLKKGKGEMRNYMEKTKTKKKKRKGKELGIMKKKNGGGEGGDTTRKEN